jgi:D-glycero-D-manno-heptose 1,7-bisphosphate phosphatase
MNRRPAVLLDRDGTINEQIDYVTRPEDLRIIPGAPEAISRLRQAGYILPIVTNQSAIARGLITESELGEIHRDMRRKLAGAGAEVDKIFYCPHHPEHGNPPYLMACTCRKPEPGLLLQAAEELHLDLERSTMVGDSLSDLQAGWNAGCRVALVLTGSGEKTRSEADSETLNRIDCIARSLSEVADWLLRQQAED